MDNKPGDIFLRLRLTISTDRFLKSHIGISKDSAGNLIWDDGTPLDMTIYDGRFAFVVENLEPPYLMYHYGPNMEKLDLEEKNVRIRCQIRFHKN